MPSPPLIRAASSSTARSTPCSMGGDRVVKIFRSRHVAPTLTPSVDLNSALNSAWTSAGRSSTRLSHRAVGTSGVGNGTWQCSGEVLTSVNEVERRSLRRVPSASATTTSSETCCPSGRSTWNTRYGCLSPTAGLEERDRGRSGWIRGAISGVGTGGPGGAKSRGKRENAGENAGGRSRPRLSSAGSCIFSPGGPPM